MTEHTYHVKFRNPAGTVASRTITVDDEDDTQDAGTALAEITIQIIRDTRYLFPGDVIEITGGE